MNGTGWLAVRSLHVLAIALLVGGQLVLVVAIISARRGSPGGARAGTSASATRPGRRFGQAIVVCADVTP